MTKAKILFLLAIICLLSTCKKEDEIIIDTNPNPDGEETGTTPTGDEPYLNLNSDYIFDQEKLLTFELKISSSNLAKIDADPAAEEYVEGVLIFEGDTLNPVGIRYKGSVGGFVGCVSGSDWSNPSGYKTCTKLSMKVKINWNASEDQFYGLKKLQFHSQNLDPSQMRERLGYWLFREMGVPAPRSVHARLVINGQYSGLYALTEQIDGRFSKYNFDDGDGNLYKEVWPVGMNGQAHNEQTYLNNLKTNEDTNPSAAIIRNFGLAISNADPSTIQNVISASMDINEILSYCVVDRTIRHDDGPFHWYCDGNGCSNHNYYWYEEPGNEQLHLIPWDLDNAFENITYNANPVTPIADGWGETSANCEPFSYGLFGIRQWSAACDKLTGGWASYTDEYEQIKTQLIEGPFSESQANTMLDIWSAQIREAIIEADQTHDDASSVAEWEQAISILKNQLEFARIN